jgi:hypothetical protein
MTTKQPPQRKAISEHRQDDPAQSKRFVEAAREAGADETEKGAGKAFKAVVKPRKSHK